MNYNYQKITEFVGTHYDEFPNFDGRSIKEIVRLLPDQDERYGDEDGLRDLLNEINYSAEEG